MNSNNVGQSVLARYGDLTMLIVSFGDGDAELGLRVNGGKVFLDGPSTLSLMDHTVTTAPSAVTMPGTEMPGIEMPVPEPSAPEPNGTHNGTHGSNGNGANGNGAAHGANGANGARGNGHGTLVISPPTPPAPVAIAPPAPVEVPAPVVVEPRVLGLYCTQDHFNDPAVAYCSVCGISMTQCTRPPEWGPRPQVGVLVTDDGTTHSLARDLVVGRTPDADEAVAAGTAGTLVLSDPLVSRVHARVTLHDWQVRVTDAGSANGTFLLPPGQTNWTRLEPGVETTVVPGSAVAFGHRELRYYSHRNR